MEHRMPNELRELVWRRLAHRDLCAAAAVSRRWRDEVHRARRAWYLGLPKASPPEEADDFLLAVLAACPELREGVEWYEWRSLPISEWGLATARTRLRELRVSEFLCAQALRSCLPSVTLRDRVPGDGQDKDDDEQHSVGGGGGGLLSSESEAQLRALVQRIGNLPNPHPTISITVRLALIPSLNEALLLASDDDCTKLHALCCSLASLNSNEAERLKMKQQLARLQQRRQETVVVKDRQEPLAISLRVVHTNEQRPQGKDEEGERWPIPFALHWPSPVFPLLLRIVNEQKVDTHQALTAISHWTVTMNWATTAKAAPRSVRLTLGQYAMLSVLQSQHESAAAATVKAVAKSMMIPASYAWVVAESLADHGLVAVIASASPTETSDDDEEDDQPMPDFYDLRRLALSELVDPGEGELNCAEHEVRLRNKYLHMDITLDEATALSHSASLALKLMRVQLDNSPISAPKLDITGLAVCIRHIQLCHCCHPCRICERSIYDAYPDKKRLAEACWRVSSHHVHCLARSSSSTATRKRAIECAAREPLPDGAHLAAPAAADLAPAARPSVGCHSYTQLSQTPLLKGLETNLNNGWQQLLQKERNQQLLQLQDQQHAASRRANIRDTRGS